MSKPVLSCVPCGEAGSHCCEDFNCKESVCLKDNQEPDKYKCSYPTKENKDKYGKEWLPCGPTETACENDLQCFNYICVKKETVKLFEDHMSELKNISNGKDEQR